MHEGQARHDLHGKRRHGYTVQGLGAETYTHGNNGNQYKQYIDDNVRILGLDHAYRGILDNGAKTHQPAGRHAVGYHEALPTDGENKARHSQRQVLPDEL